MLPGVTRRTLNSGKRMMLIEVTFEEGAVVPFHSHLHEQIGYLASGRLLFEIAGLGQEVSAGASWLVPGYVPHQVTALEPSVAIDIFSPPREEYR